MGQARHPVRKTAKECTKDEAVAELWAQLKDGLNDAGKATLRDEDRLVWFMDPAVTGPGGPDPQNREQLLVHPTGTLYNRPSARTRVPNFFLAGGYVRTDVDLATTEGANEFARRAVNAPPKADNSDAGSCRIRELYRPPETEPLKRVDEARYRLGLPNAFDLGQAGRAAAPERRRPSNPWRCARDEGANQRTRTAPDAG